MDEVKLFAVAGDPVLHSKSPDMFNAAFQVQEMSARYLRLALDHPREMRRLMTEIGISGLNVTAPFKEDALPVLNEIDDAARLVGAVNTITFNNGRLAGYNTDVEGVTRALFANNVPVYSSKSIVLGAGGAAKAAVRALLSEGSDVTICNRTSQKARDLAHLFGCSWAPLEAIGDKLSACDILVSCLSTADAVVPTDGLSKKTAVLDAFYGEESALIRAGREKGCLVIDGREWLLYQGAAAFRRFTDITPPLDAMRDALSVSDIAGKTGIALIGFMGTGKTVTGRHLAHLFDVEFFDTDHEIETRHGSSISRIFADNGEAGFRAMETAAIEIVTSMGPSVISCGGGAVLNKDNVKLIRKNHMVVWLWANTEAILDRVDNDGTRPLLNVDDRRAATERMLIDRKPYYATACDLLIDTTDKRPEEVAERIFHESRHILAR